jgi:hypothetical protein
VRVGEFWEKIVSQCLIDAHGTVDEQAVARYRETGTEAAEWDFGPVISGDGDDVVPDRPGTARRRAGRAPTRRWRRARPTSGSG